MLELTGKHNTAKIFTDMIDSETISQIINLLNQEFIKDSQIRIMPDCHAGAGCTIGTTMTLHDKVVANLVGVDIGCGMHTTELNIKASDIDMKKLDSVIRKYVPSGFNTHKSQKHKTSLDCTQLRCWNKKDAHINDRLAYCSIGTLGGGNHFIELDVDENDNVYLVVHTGSRHLGLEIAKYYQELAYAKLCSGDLPARRSALIAELKAQNRQSEIQTAIQYLETEYRKQHPSVPKDLAYLEGDDFSDYIHDMKMVQEHAYYNRKAIVKTICSHMDFSVQHEFETIHNYIDTDHMILRKGAVSARDNEMLLIPMNMRDGSLLCYGKGNDDWNQSAPHGAGRLMSRSKAKSSIKLDDFKETMSGIFSTSVNQSTIDESPFAYKPMDSIIENIKDTVEIAKIIKPIYNFKAGDA